MARILIYGSSTTYGLHDTQGGWAGRVKSRLQSRYLNHERPVADVFNLASASRLFSSILDCMDTDIKVYGDGRPVVAAFMLGATDSRILKNQTEPVVKVPDFKASLARLAEICTRQMVSPVFVGLTPINDSLTHPFMGGDVYDSNLRREYDAIVEDHAQAVGAPFVPVWDRLVAEQAAGNEILVDWEGLHMNAAGHTIVCDAAFPVIDATLCSLATNAVRVTRPVQAMQFDQSA